MTDALDSLPDSALNELFAVEVAELEPIGSRAGYWHSLNRHKIPGARVPEVNIHLFCIRADAVLPWLQKWNGEAGDVAIYSGDGYWQVSLFEGRMDSAKNQSGQAGGSFARAISVPRAACVALIRAKRARK